MHSMCRSNKMSPHSSRELTRPLCFAHRFLDFFQELGANSDVGRNDVTQGLLSHDDGLDETTPYILGKDVQVNIDAPSDNLRYLKYRVLQLIGDVCILSFLFAVGSFTWICLQAAVGFVGNLIVDEVNQGLRGALALFPGVLVVLVSTLVHQTMGVTVFLGIGWLFVPLVFGFLARFRARFLAPFPNSTRFVRKALASFPAWHELIPQRISAGAQQIWQLFPDWMPKMRNQIIAFFFPVCSVGLICIELCLAAPECIHLWWMIPVMLLLTYTAWHSSTSSRIPHTVSDRPSRPRSPSRRPRSPSRRRSEAATAD